MTPKRLPNHLPNCRDSERLRAHTGTKYDLAEAPGGGGPPGGFGAVATAKLPVTPGQFLFIEVGGNGGIPVGGFNGGAGGGGSGVPGGGGGGATDIRTISRAKDGSINARLITAAGGGGGNSATGDTGGAGGQAGQLPSGNGSSGSAGNPPDNGHANSGYGGRGGQIGMFYGSYGGPASGGFNGSAGGGNFGGEGGAPGTGPGSVPPNFYDAAGGGGGGGGGWTSFALTANDRSISTDTSGVPLLRITYKLGGSGSKNGLKYGKVKLNKKKGTAILPVTVSGSGKLSIGGKGVVKKRPAFGSASRRLAKEITEAGTYKPKVKAKGQRKRKLFATGQLKVKAIVTFKPSSGDAVHDTKRIRLKKS